MLFSPIVVVDDLFGAFLYYVIVPAPTKLWLWEHCCKHPGYWLADKFNKEFNSIDLVHRQQTRDVYYLSVSHLKGSTSSKFQLVRRTKILTARKRLSWDTEVGEVSRNVNRLSHEQDQSQCSLFRIRIAQTRSNFRIFRTNLMAETWLEMVKQLIPQAYIMPLQKSRREETKAWTSVRNPSREWRTAGFVEDVKSRPELQFSKSIFHFKFWAQFPTFPPYQCIRHPIQMMRQLSPLSPSFATESRRHVEWW